MIKIFYSILIFIFFCSNTFAQSERETRAVWVSTNFRLDWPPPVYDSGKQKAALADILDNIKSKNLNTVYFQVRSSGTVMFNSSLDPLSPYITGQVNGAADYDPLEFAVKEAHRRGLEIHAWFNIFRCFSGSESNIFSSPDHISKRKPEWVIEDRSNGAVSYWLDPGLPEVREYLSDLITEAVEKYDIDGVQLDFIRYPGKNFEDDFSYGVYGNGMKREDWRRKNITDFVAELSSKIRAVKPFVKIGATPIGIYKNPKGFYGFEGYGEVFQDSRKWLADGLIDYLTPQVYWSFEDKPKFDVLAKEWAENSAGRSIVIGVAAYKDNVKPEMEKMIALTRSIKADGISFFRYSNIKDYDFKSFEYKTYPPIMTWLDGFYPDAPHDLYYEFRGGSPNFFTLKWKAEESHSGPDTLRYFALYNLPDSLAKVSKEYLYDLLPSGRNSVSIKIDKPRKVNYYFTLKSVSKLWNESINSSNVIGIRFPELNLLSRVGDIFTNPVLLKEVDGTGRILFFSEAKDEIEISGGGESLKYKVSPGKNVISLPWHLDDYRSISIRFANSKKSAELKLR